MDDVEIVPPAEGGTNNNTRPRKRRIVAISDTLPEGSKFKVKRDDFILTQGYYLYEKIENVHKLKCTHFRCAMAYSEATDKKKYHRHYQNKHEIDLEKLEAEAMGFINHLEREDALEDLHED